MKFSIKITGVNQFRKDLTGFAHRLPILTKDAAREIMQKIHEQAMRNLNENIIWGHSIHGDNIEQSMQVTEMGRDSIMLTYTSPHAWIVEHGGIGEVIRPRGVFPIGASQGNVVAFSPKFKLQQGKHYLERAVDIVMADEETQRIINRHISRGLRGLGGL